MIISIISKNEKGNYAIDLCYTKDQNWKNKLLLKKSKIVQEIELKPYRMVFYFKCPNFINRLKWAKENKPDEYKNKLDQKINNMHKEMEKNGAIRDIDYIIEVKDE